MSLRGKDLISCQDWTRPEIDAVIDSAIILKRQRQMGIDQTDILKGRTLYSIFYNSSTRTRASFLAAMDQLGGGAHVFNPDAMQISVGEQIKDTAQVLDRYGDAISVRYCFVKENYGEGNQVLRDYAKYSKVPVLNMECDMWHPHQALADLMTMKERFGSLEGKKITISWAYGKYIRPVAVPQSLVALMTRYGANVTLAYPSEEFALDPTVIDQAKINAAQSGGSFEITNNIEEAFEGAHVVYPKNWGALSLFPDMDAVAELQKNYTHWKATAKLMSTTKSNGIYMHCLPCDRGLEVEDEVIDGPQSAVWDQAENRLHAQKAVLANVITR